MFNGKLKKELQASRESAAEKQAILDAINNSIATIYFIP